MSKFVNMMILLAIGAILLFITLRVGLLDANSGIIRFMKALPAYALLAAGGGGG